jgi:RNA polymerase sigma factor (sigma-70 family)
MNEKPPDSASEGADLRRRVVAVTTAQAHAWFVREVLPLEATLTRYLRRNWHNASEIEDFRQDVYERVLEAAEVAIPDRTRAYVFSTARNLLIDRLRKESVVPIEAVADLEALDIAADEAGPERSAFARDLLRRLQSALDHLPPRCREAVILKRIEGLTQRKIAERMGISEQSVANHVARGMCVLADAVYGEQMDAGSSR